MPWVVERELRETHTQPSRQYSHWLDISVTALTPHCPSSSELGRLWLPEAHVFSGIRSGLVLAMHWDEGL